MTIYDCSLFKDELDMLELRLQELYPVVDKFVIVEADHSFLHRPKPYYFLENIQRFAPYLDKIIRVEFCDQIPNSLASMEGVHYTGYEAPQRNAIMRGLVGSADDDIATICDADEILSRETIQKLRQGVGGKVRFHTQMHYYSLNHLVSGKWYLTTAAPIGLLRRSSPTKVRHEIEPGESIWPDSGWHFSFFGSNQVLRDKLSDYSERRYDRPEFVTDSNLDTCREQGLDFAHRPDALMNVVSEPPSLPETIKSNRDKYKTLGWFKEKS